MISSPLFLSAAYDIVFNEDELSLEERHRRDRRIPRVALQYYEFSSFKFMYDSGNDQALLNCCAVDHKTFKELLNIVGPLFDRYTVDDKKDGKIRPRKLSKHGKPLGRPREIDNIGLLGLVLYWYRTKGSVARGISMAFGLTSTPLYKWLKFARKVLLVALQKNPSAKVYFPTQQEIDLYKAAIASKYDKLVDVWGACDGLKLHIQASTNWQKQNYFYNGWKCCHYVNCIFAFAPDGKIRLCTINAPGSFHDSTQADYGVYQKMEELYDRYGAKTCVDSAFKLPCNSKPFLVKSSQQDPVGDADGVVLNRQATSLRQLSEHGMRMIQAQFPRMLDPLPYEEYGERKVIIQLMILLYNYQAIHT